MERRKQSALNVCFLLHIYHAACHVSWTVMLCSSIYSSLLQLQVGMHDMYWTDYLIMGNFILSTNNEIISQQMDPLLKSNIVYVLSSTVFGSLFKEGLGSITRHLDRATGVDWRANHVFTNVDDQRKQKGDVLTHPSLLTTSQKTQNYKILLVIITYQYRLLDAGNYRFISIGCKIKSLSCISNYVNSFMCSFYCHTGKKGANR